MNQYQKIPFYKLRDKIICDHLDRFPNAGNMTIAKILYRDHHEMFSSLENARSIIRLKRGANGEKSRLKIKDRRYVKV